MPQIASLHVRPLSAVPMSELCTALRLLIVAARSNSPYRPFVKLVTSLVYTPIEGSTVQCHFSSRSHTNHYGLNLIGQGSERRLLAVTLLQDVGRYFLLSFISGPLRGECSGVQGSERS